MSNFIVVLLVAAGAQAQMLPGGPISAYQLRHPLTRKAAKLIEKAQRLAHAGNHVEAILELEKALAEPSAVPYARSLLGVEYLKTGQPDRAFTELESAVALLPNAAENHANLGYVLCLRGELAQAEASIRRALALNPGSPQSRYLLGFVLLQRGGSEKEALALLESARHAVPSAARLLDAYRARQAASAGAASPL